MNALTGNRTRAICLEGKYSTSILLTPHSCFKILFEILKLFLIEMFGFFVEKKAK